MEFDLSDLKTLKSFKHGARVHHLRFWLCLFMKSHYQTTRRWPRTKLIAQVFGYHHAHLKAAHLTPMVKMGYLRLTPPPYNPLTRYRVVKEYPYHGPEPTGPSTPCDAFEEGDKSRG